MNGTVEVRSASGAMLNIPAAATPVPGLWVGAHPRGGYTIVHEGSKACIGRSPYPDAEAALACAVELGALADWSGITEPTVYMPTAEIAKIDAVVRRWGSVGVWIRGRDQ